MDEEFVKIRKKDLDFLQSQMDKISEEKKNLLKLYERELRQHEKDVEMFKKIIFRILNGILLIIAVYLIGYWLQIIFNH